MQQGRYRGRISKVQVGETTNGNPQIVYTVELDGRVGADGDDTSCAGVSRSIFRVLTENTVKYAFEDLRRLGYDRDDLDGVDPSSPGAFNFVGTPVTVRMELKTSNKGDGSTFEEWSFSFGGGAPAVKPVADRGKMAKLNALFRQEARSSGVAPARRPPPAAGERTEDKIPF